VILLPAPSGSIRSSLDRLGAPGEAQRAQKAAVVGRQQPDRNSAGSPGASACSALKATRIRYADHRAGPVRSLLTMLTVLTVKRFAISGLSVDRKFG